MPSLDLPAAHQVEDDRDGVVAFRLPPIPAVRARWAQLRERSPSGQFRLLISTPFIPRTVGERSQNNCIHGWRAWICMVTGDEYEDFCRFIGRRAFRRGFPAKTNARGDVVLSRVDGLPLPESTAKVSKEQAQAYLEELKQFASEESIPLPEYDERGRVIFR